MKKITFLFFASILFVTAINAQSIQIPFASITPAPLQPLEEDGVGVISFPIVETGGIAVPAMAFNMPNITISVNFQDIKLTDDDVSLLSGDLLDYFVASYNPTTNILILEQFEIFPALSGATINIPITVTANSTVLESTNGYNANIVSVDGNTNAQGNSSIFTFTSDPNIVIASDDINNGFQDEVMTGNVVTNDSDPDGGVLTVTTIPVTPPTNGTVLLNTDGSYTYTPTAGYVGEDSFEYQVCDNGTPIACETATVYLEVLPVGSAANEVPIANVDTGTTEINTDLTGDLLSNDFDPDGDPLTITTTPVTNPTNGNVTINPDGTYTYTPNTDFEGEDSFEYQVCDDASPTPSCDTAIVTITVVADDANITIANDDAANTMFEMLVSGNVLDNDFDPEGDDQIVSITPVTSPTSGSLVLSADGSFDYTPNAGFTGQDSFVYQVCDDNAASACDTATVYITVSDFINTVLAADDINNGFQDEVMTGNVVTNDSDPDDGVLTVTTTPVTPPTNGTVVLNTDGSYTYTPTAGYVGEDSFEYQVCDDGNPTACDTATVYIEVLSEGSAANEAPIANTDTGTTEVNTNLTGDLLANDFDPDGDLLTITTTPITNPTNGSVTINPDGTYTYTPNTDFEGEDSFEYQVCDDASPTPSCDTAVVTITVLADVANITTANDDAYNTMFDTAVSGNVTDNDFDAEGNTQTVSIISGSGPSNGTLVLNTVGGFDYMPSTGFTGQDSFVYQVCDNGVPSACDTATVYITVSDIMNTVLAVDDINNGFQDVIMTGNVVTNDSDPDGGILTVTTTPVAPPTSGTVSLNADGSYTYTPATGFVGEDSFEYQVCDNGNPEACDTATVYLEVLSVGSPDNEAPIANIDTGTTEVGTPLTGDLLANDFDPDGDLLTITTTPITDPTNGMVTINPDGTYTYTPDPGFEGEDSFEYQVCDDGSPVACDTATVSITVLADDANITTANDDAYNVPPISVFTANVLDNDFDAEGNTQIVATTPVTGPSNGTLVLSADGSFDYTPNAGFTGQDSFVYQVCDDNAISACDTATVYLLIEGSPDYFPSIFTSETIVNGVDPVTIDFVVFVGELLNNDSNPGIPVAINIAKNPSLSIVFDDSLITLNDRDVNNSDWSFDDSDPFFYRMVFIGNNNIFIGGTSSSLGFNATFTTVDNSQGAFPLKATVISGSGGEINFSNNNDIDVIEFRSN